jgi:Kef-type K+ transport system membrane component KefB
MSTSLYVGVVLFAVVLVASMVSVELGLSVAIIEIVLGVLVGNTLGLPTPDWLTFLAGFGSVVLTFLAGAEVDPGMFRSNLKASMLIGWFSFAAPFIGCMLLARYGLGWGWRPAQIAGTALSTTSVAVVYAVLVETGLNATFVGKLLMSSTFITDFGTVLALSILFVHPNWWLVAFAGASVALIVVMPRLEGWFFARYGDRVIEPEIKGAFAALLLLMYLANRAQSHAVLPAFLLGLAMARTFQRHHATQQRFRVVAFALLTPAFFVSSGMKVSLGLVWANLGLLVVFLAAKLAAKSVAVYPVARRYVTEHATFTTLLMSTGLTFGTISATYGYAAGIINRAQFSVLVTVVVLTAVLPTAVAQRFFSPPTTPTQPAPAQAPAADRPADIGSPHGRRPTAEAAAEPADDQPEQRR